MRLDGFIRKTLKDDVREAVTANIIAFETQFLGLMPTAEIKEENRNGGNNNG